ncbi:MAG: ABC transporter permease [Ilumatobacter sp.]|uniref:ABC transporter permease n=1 Tax=Ilumatobacter sp. TaxID=1967498 RepID=UPI002623D594|nr:ABC transporter permease [Ilumatobacter sp.]MDJ0771480.1 ABC transporter permease [Ilumatobacter sp.]
MQAEWIKLRTVMAHWVLVGIAIVFPVAIVILFSAFAEITFTLDSQEVANVIVGLVVVTALLLGAMAATSLTSDYTHNVIRPTFAATTSRARVHAAKLTVNSVVIAVVSFVTVVICWTIAQLIFDGRDLSISLGDDGVVPQLVSISILGVLVSWFGYGLGLIIRNAAATITILLIWPLIIENLVALLFTALDWEGVNKWLPYSAAISDAVADDSVDTLGRPWGAIWFAAIGLAMIAFGGWLDHRRDA